jgi:hypothetical protein
MSQEKAVVLKCPKCDIVIVAPDLNSARGILAALKEKLWKDSEKVKPAHDQPE